MKANIKDVCALVDMKANVEDINKSFTDILNDFSHSFAPKKCVEDLLSE